MTSEAADQQLRVAYLMSRFPKISETFILYEILAVQELGVHVEIFPLVREREPVRHREADDLAQRAHDVRLASWQVAAAQLFWLRKAPGAYLSAWGAAIRGNIRSARFLLRALATVPLAATFARAIRELQIHHIHAHWATHPALAAYVASRLTGIPYSFTAHAHDIYVERPMLKEKIGASRFVVTISEYNRRFLERLYGGVAAARLEVIHCGTDPALFRPPETTGDRPWTIVCVASLQPQKGHRHLVEACGLLAAGGLAFRCLLIGDGESRPALERQIAVNRLGDRVELMGQQPRHRVAELVGRADVVVQPSVVLATGKTEGIPVALMEAMAMERPVIASALSGIPELVEDGVTGVLIPPGDVEALAEALRSLYADPQRATTLGRNARARVIAEFDLRVGAARLARLFAER